MVHYLSPKFLYTLMPKDYWHVDEPRGKYFSPGSLKGYYIDMSKKTAVNGCPSDGNGYPLKDLDGHTSLLLPVTVTQFALGHYDLWLETGEPSHKIFFLSAADWLVKNLVPFQNQIFGWLYDFSIYRYRMKRPFISAMGQGQGISVLVRAHELTKDDRYIDAARAAYTPFEHEVENGGVIWKDKNSGFFFEEYPCSPASHVLNGHIFALWGIYDYMIYLETKSAEALFRDGIAALVSLLPEFDMGYWSRYDLYPHSNINIASPFYQALHASQLESLHILTNEPVFGEYAKIFDRQFTKWSGWASALASKLKYKFGVKHREQ